eukprot:3547139-Amphidinium_carterae.3
MEETQIVEQINWTGHVETPGFTAQTCTACIQGCLAISLLRSGRVTREQPRKATLVMELTGDEKAGHTPVTLQPVEMTIRTCHSGTEKHNALNLN